MIFTVSVPRLGHQTGEPHRIGYSQCIECFRWMMRGIFMYRFQSLVHSLAEVPLPPAGQSMGSVRGTPETCHSRLCPEAQSKHTEDGGLRT